MFSALKTCVALGAAAAALGVAMAAISNPRDASSALAARTWQRGAGPADTLYRVATGFAARTGDPLQDRFYSPAVVLLASR